MSEEQIEEQQEQTGPQLLTEAPITTAEPIVETDEEGEE